MKLLRDLQSEKKALLDKKNLVLEEIQDINDQLKEYEDTGCVHLSPVDDPSWVIRTRDARKHKLRNLRELEIELDDIKFNQKELTRSHDVTLATAFYKAAKISLPEDVFNRILENCQ